MSASRASNWATVVAAFVVLFNATCFVLNVLRAAVLYLVGLRHESWDAAVMALAHFAVALLFVEDTASDAQGVSHG